MSGVVVCFPLNDWDRYVPSVGAVSFHGKLGMRWGCQCISGGYGNPKSHWKGRSDSMLPHQVPGYAIIAALKVHSVHTGLQFAIWGDGVSLKVLEVHEGI